MNEQVSQIFFLFFPRLTFFGLNRSTKIFELKKRMITKVKLHQRQKKFIKTYLYEIGYYYFRNRKQLPPYVHAEIENTVIYIYIPGYYLLLRVTLGYIN